MRILAAVVAFSALPASAFAQSVGNSAFTTAIASHLQDAQVQSASGAAVISGPVGTAAAGSAVASGTLETARVWIKTYGFDSHVGADVNGPAYSTRGIGGAFGVEKLVLPNLLVGAALGYTSADTSSTVQDVKASTLSGALYASYASQGFELNGVAGLNGTHYDSSRWLSLGGAPTFFAGSAHGLGWSLYGDAGYRFQVPTALGPGFVKPIVAVAYSALDRDAFAEVSPGGLALNYQAQTFRHLTSLAGIDFGATHSTNGFFIRPELRIGWVHEYTDPAPPVFAAIGALPLVTKDPNPGRDGLAVAAQATMWSKPGTQFFVAYQGEFRSNLAAHQGTAGLRFSW